MNHTPGNWKLGGLYRQNIFANPTPTTVKHIATLEADVEGMKFGYTLEQRANARLILAAPKMLECLEQVRKYFAQHDDALDFGELQTHIDEAIADATPSEVKR